MFRAIDPRDVFEKIKIEYADFLESVQSTLDREVKEVKEKFVIKNCDVGLKTLKDQMKKAKTIEISNATSDFIKRVSDAFDKDAVVKVLLFPGEKKINVKNIQFKEAEIKIVCMVRNREIPSMSVILDESRIFTVVQDPVDHRYVVDEMLYDECSKCFAEWNALSWSAC